MRPFGNNRTHASNGQELSQMFIGDDGKLSIWIKDDEYEVVGLHNTIFNDCLQVVRK